MADSALVDSYRELGSIRKVAARWHMPHSTVAARLRTALGKLRPSGRRRSAVAQMLGEIAAMRGER